MQYRKDIKSVNLVNKTYDTDIIATEWLNAEGIDYQFFDKSGEITRTVSLHYTELLAVAASAVLFEMVSESEITELIGNWRNEV